jgi:hypothetical protein
MSDYTRTPHYNLYKPTPDADDDAWGDHLNWNADTLDTLLGPSGALPFLPLTGGTVTGPLALPVGAVDAPSLTVDPTGTTGLYQGATQTLAVSAGGVRTVMFHPTYTFCFAPLDLQSNRISNMADAIDATDALNMRVGDARYLPLTGPATLTVTALATTALTLQSTNNNTPPRLLLTAPTNTIIAGPAVSMWNGTDGASLRWFPGQFQMLAGTNTGSTTGQPWLTITPNPTTVATLAIGQDTSSANSGNTGISLNNPPGGLMMGGVNTFQWGSDTADTAGAGQFGSVVNVFHQMMPGFKGPRNSINSISIFFGPSANTDPSVQFYCGAQAAIYAYNGDGGTSGSPKGGIFGGSFLGMAMTGTDYVGVMGAEVNYGLSAGTSSLIKCGISVNNELADAVTGSIVDANLALGNRSPSVANTFTIQLTNINGYNPLSPTGSVIGSNDIATIGDILHFPTYTISGNIITTPLVTLAGDGSLQLGTIGTSGGLLAVHNSAGATVALDSPAANNRFVYLQTSGANRWMFGANLAAESGTNAGSDFQIIAWDDAGTAPTAIPITISRATGVVDFSVRPTVAGVPVLAADALDEIAARLAALEARIATPAPQQSV